MKLWTRLFSEPEPDPAEDVAIEIFNLDGHTRDWPTTEEDLDAIVASYNPAFLEAPVNLDHTDSGQAYGWIKSVAREGRKLVACLRQVAPELKEAVRSGRYKNRSVELLTPDHGSFPEASGIAGHPYLTGLAFLGAALPAVKGMAPITGFSADDSEIVRIESDEKAELYSVRKNEEPAQEEVHTKGTEPMDGHEADVFTARIEKLEEIVAEFTEQAREQSEELTALAAERDSLKDELAQYAADAEAAKLAERDASIDRKIAELEEAGVVTPAEHEEIASLFSELPDERHDALFSQLKKQEKKIPTGPAATAPAPKRLALEGEEAQVTAAREYMDKHKGVSFADAISTILKG